MKTRAAVMYKHNEPVVVEELELDEPKANEVLAALLQAGSATQTCQSSRVLSITMPLSPLDMKVQGLLNGLARM